MSGYDYPQLAADIITNLPDDATPADARRALQNLDPLAQTAALATTTTGGSSSGGPELVTATITSTQLLALTVEEPIELEPARPETILVLVWVVIVGSAGSTPYDPDILPFVGIQYGPPLYPLGGGSSQAVPIAVNRGMLQTFAPLAGQEGVAAEIVNRPLSLFLDPVSNQFTGGDYDLTIAITFMAVPYTP